jgi:endonuclease YncB( thermonuclease family)
LRYAEVVRNVLLAVVLFLAACRADAQPLRATVTHVADGDSFHARDIRGRKLEIRILGIDAPERNQPFADASRRALIKLIRGKEIEIHVAEPDRHGRLVSRIVQGGVDVGHAQLKSGMAWVYPWAQTMPSGYREAERAARAARAGLWRDPKPREPWKYRRGPYNQ